MEKCLRECKLQNESNKGNLSSCLFNLYSENMIYKAIGDHKNKVSIGRFKIKTIKFEDDRAIVSGWAKALQEVVNKINFTTKQI